MVKKYDEIRNVDTSMRYLITGFMGEVPYGINSMPESVFNETQIPSGEYTLLSTKDGFDPTRETKIVI